ncbi:MAG: phosphotransferase [Anaerolineales bacterium]|nr:phosphotransferase [Anaerolineales bacterium]
MFKSCEIPPTDEAIQAVLQAVEPGSMLTTFALMPGSFSNYTHVIDARTARGAAFRLVIRRYKVFGDYDRGEKAAREYQTFELLQRHGIPAPRPLILDVTGDMVGSPGIVTSFVPGKSVYTPADPVTWAHALAKMLAKIHTIPCDAETQNFLLDGDAEVSWFIRGEAPPDYMLAHPNGAKVWQTVKNWFPARRPGTPGLMHIDFWSGNILWKGTQISAVLDWEEAAFGNPAYDVAYSLLDIMMLGYGHVADEFLRVYEAERGCPVADLGFWQLAASVRPMFGWGDEIFESPAKERLEGFIADAFRRVAG